MARARAVRDMPLSIPSSPMPEIPQLRDGRRRVRSESPDDDDSDDSSSSSSGSPERDLEDDCGSIMDHNNDSQSSLSVSLEEMELDAVEFEERCKISPISRLPAELIIAVFSRLSSADDVRNCMLTCKNWARNSVDLLWHKPSTDKWEDLQNVILTLRKQKSYFAYNDLIKRLNFSKLGDKASDGVLQQFLSCRRIERLTLTDCCKLTDRSIVPLVKNNHSLLAIDISNCEEVTDDCLNVIAATCYKLQGLNVTKCRHLTNDSLIDVAKNCRRLKRIKLNECSQVTDAAVLTFADFCHDIVEIDLQKVHELTDTSVTALMIQERQLRELRLPHCVKITDEAFLKLPPGLTLDALRILDLTDCNELGDIGIQAIVHAAPKLRNLVLAKCRNITDRGIMAITRLGKNLHYIHLGHCSNITDYGVINLTRYCNRIRYIDLACCANLTDESVRQLASSPKLKRIGLVKCNNITDASILALASPKPVGSNGSTYPNALERLHLSYCTHLTIKGVRQMLLSCPRLNHLSLTGVPEFLRDDLLQYCRKAPPEFNEHQREVFCVFSGHGVNNLRCHLNDHYPSPVEPDMDFNDSRSQIMGPAAQPWAPHGYVIQQALAQAASANQGPGGPHDHGQPLAYLAPQQRMQQLQMQIAALNQQQQQAAQMLGRVGSAPAQMSHLAQHLGTGVTVAVPINQLSTSTHQNHQSHQDVAEDAPPPPPAHHAGPGQAQQPANVQAIDDDDMDEGLGDEDDDN